MFAPYCANRYNSLAAAADHPELVSSLVLLNAAGRFEADSPAALQQQEQPEEEEEVAAQQGSVFDRLWAEALTAVKRGVVFGSFLLAKQPARIRQVGGLDSSAAKDRQSGSGARGRQVGCLLTERTPSSHISWILEVFMCPLRHCTRWS